MLIIIFICRSFNVDSVNCKAKTQGAGDLIKNQHGAVGREWVRLGLTNLALVFPVADNHTRPQ